MRASPLLSTVVIAVFLGLLAGVHYYLYRRLIKDTAPTRSWRIVGTALLAFAAASQVILFASARFLPPGPARILAYPAATWMAVIMWLVFAFVLWDTLRLVADFWRKLRRPAPPVHPERRVFLSRVAAGTAGLATVGMSSAAAANAARQPTVVRRTVYLPRLPKAWSGLRIAQLSDVHVGMTITGSWLAQVVERTNALRPDITVITGDLVDGLVDTLAPEVAPLFSLSAPLGVYFVTGNHEYYFDAPAWVAHLERNGIRVLKNEHVVLYRDRAPLCLAGLHDHQGRIIGVMKPDLRAALFGRPPGAETILLNHRPTIVHRLSGHEVGLVLAGHTHGGQLWPLNYLVGINYPYLKGLYRHDERTQIYVNQGTGVWGPPMRLGTFSEITLLTLETEQP